MAKIKHRTPFEVDGEWFKVCSKCETAKQFSCFWSDKRNSYGITSICKICVVECYCSRKPAKPVIIYKDVKNCDKCLMERPLHSFKKHTRADGSVGYSAKCHNCKANLPPTNHRPYIKEGVLVKYCASCETVQNLESFVKRGKSYGYCKKCESKKKRDAWENATPEWKEKRREYSKIQARSPKSRETKSRWRFKEYHSNVDYRNKVLASGKNYMTPEKRRKYSAKYGSKYSIVYRARRNSAKLVIYFSKDEITKRDGLICYLCDKKLTKRTATLEHLIPISRGGNHTPENVKLACQSCNSSKRDKTVTEFKKWRGDYDRFKTKKKAQA